MSEAEEQAEKRRLLLQNKSACDGPIFFDHAEAAQLGGRWSHLNRPTVIKSASDYPAAPQWSKDAALVPDEPPLGFAVDG
jgi:hypothetical protein